MRYKRLVLHKVPVILFILLIFVSPSNSLEHPSLNQHRNYFYKQLNVLPKEEKNKFRELFSQLFPSVSSSPSVSTSISPTTSLTPSSSASSSSTPKESPYLSPSITPSKSPSTTPFRNKSPQASPARNMQRVKIGSTKFSVPIDGSESNNEVRLSDIRGAEAFSGQAKAVDVLRIDNIVANGDFGSINSLFTRTYSKEKYF